VLNWKARIWLLTLLAGGLQVTAAPVSDWGCFYSQDGAAGFDPGWTAVGPVLEHSRGGGVVLDAVRPFYTRETDGRGRTVTDVLWPVATMRKWGNDSDWRFLTAVGHDDDAGDPAGAYRAWFLPFFFFGRNRAGEDYGAVFPLGGRIEGWYGRDEVSFILFPLYARSRLKDIETHHVLWPLLSRTTGDAVYQARFFPFYGYSRRGDMMERTFILWPVWNRVKDCKPGASGGGFMLFPFGGHVKMGDQETWMLLPPFFRHTRTREGTAGACPWPLVQWQQGKSRKLYVWPLYGRRTSEGDNVSFWAWPLVWKGRTQRDGVQRDRFRVFPVYSQEVLRKADQSGTAVADRYVSVWPLVSYRQSGSNTTWRMMDLWPFRDTPAIERNLAPWWTVYDRRRTGEGTSGRLLWGLARWSTRKDGEVYRSLFPLGAMRRDRQGDRYREWEFLKGAAGYRRDESGRSYRLLYFLRWRSGP